MWRLLILVLCFNMMDAQKMPKIDWQNPAEFSAFPEKLGLAGMMAAKVSDGFLIAGGANFPEALPWEGGKKYFSDKIFFWDGATSAPQVLEIKLPTGIAYGGYTSFDNQLIIIGGETAEGASNRVYAVSKTGIKELAELPQGVMAPAVAQVKGKIYLVGGDTASKTLSQFLSLDLGNTSAKWETLPDLPITTANAAIFSVENQLFVASGRSKNPNGISTLNTEVFGFDFKNNRWEKETSVTIDGEVSPFVASAFFTYKNRYLVFAGGDDGKTFNKIETFLNKMANATNDAEKQTFTNEKNYLVKHHQGFNNRSFAYDTKTRKWLKSSRLPFTANVTTASLLHGDQFYIFSGEIRPGVRSPKIWVGTIK